MNAFDLFRGFFSVPGGHHRGRRDPFFDEMTHDDDDDDDDGGFYHDGSWGEQQDPFDSTWRFGFSFGPDGMRIQQPPVFGHVLREMEEMFSQMGHWDAALGSGHFGTNTGPDGVPPSQDREEKGGGGGGGPSGNPLRDFMLKTPDAQGPQPERSIEPRHDYPFSSFHDMWRPGPGSAPVDQPREDGDLDSAVSAGGLDQILVPPAGQTPGRPGIQSFFQSVSISTVVKPDGTVEERRTVRDGKGNEETTVTRSGGPEVLQAPDDQPGPVVPGGQRPFSDLQDYDSLFSKFFRGFK